MPLTPVTRYQSFDSARALRTGYLCNFKEMEARLPAPPARPVIVAGPVIVARADIDRRRDDNRGRRIDHHHARPRPTDDCRRPALVEAGANDIATAVAPLDIAPLRRAVDDLDHGPLRDRRGDTEIGARPLPQSHV